MAFLASAVALPLMCAYQQPPLPAFFNQTLAVALWSGVLLVLALARVLAPSRAVPNSPTTSGYSRGWATVSPALLWGLLLAVVAAHALTGWTPFFIAAPNALNLALALWLSLVVAGDVSGPQRLQRWLHALLIGILIAALFNAFAALIQLLAPGWADDTWIARAVPPQDRASGNLRQPNQLATLMLWGLLATSYFWRRRPALWLAFSAPLLATLVATGSRTGMLSLLLIVVVALMRSQRVRAWRWRGWLALMLAVIPLLWFAESIFTRNTANVALTVRLALWRDTLAIMGQYPWWGVGWGQLNFAWTLTPLPSRAADVFDHAHNLPLHLAAEIGVPLTVLALAGLGSIIWRARSAWATSEGATAGLLLATVLLHSLFEYPLWFSYFLLPTAFVLAWLVAWSGTHEHRNSCAVAVTKAATKAVAKAAAKAASTPRRISVIRARSVTAVLAAVFSVVALASIVFALREYQKAVDIHRAVGRPEVLARAISNARGSPLFGHFGDYAAIMLKGDAATPDLFARPVRHVLDERLLVAYARMLSRAGEADRAAFVVARAREFPPDVVFSQLPRTAASSPAATPLTARDFRR